MAGNATSQAVAITVADVADLAATINLGIHGQLIAPVQVEGRWYYHWDRSGDGTSANSGNLNGGTDQVDHNELNSIFTYSSDFSTQGGGGNTDDTYRYATIEGVRVALPSANGGLNLPQGMYARQYGTAYTDNGGNSNGTTTSSYDDLLAIWDAYNGTGTGQAGDGTPPGWTSADYWSATPSESGHAQVGLYNGYVYNNVNTERIYVALQVL